LDAANELTHLLGLGLATIVATDERQESGGFKVRYLFEPVIALQGSLADIFVTLEVSLEAEKPSVPSITPLVPAANWHEREMRDMFGIEPEGHPDPRPLVLHDGWPKQPIGERSELAATCQPQSGRPAGLYPLRKDFDPNTQPERLPAEEFPHLMIQGEGVMEIPVGPIHAGIIEPGHFRFSSVGETVLQLDARLFYTHRGLEKRAEGLTHREAFFIAERLCGACSVTNGLAFAEAVEQIAGVTAPPRAQFLRTIALELERLYNHVGDIGAICAGVGYHWGTSVGARLKEEIQRENERLTGNRFLRGLVIPGGVHADLTAQQIAEVATIARVTGEQLAELMDSFSHNSSVMDRMDHTGALSSRIAKDLGVTGVAARASGIDRDARRDHPHAAYAGAASWRAPSGRVGGDALAPAKGVPAPVGPAGTGDLVPRVEIKFAGDAHSRIKVRETEAFESIRLLQLLVATLPPGPLSVSIPDVLAPWRTGLSVVESPRGASIHWLRTDGQGRVDRYHVRSASYANWPAVPYAALNAIVPDFPLVNKSFELCYACTDR
jgi:Ni,Fe-hydrogenase III large subunit/NADH:ubiquinone oxidoreductase subunit C